jgi:hypothetical protein
MKWFYTSFAYYFIELTLTESGGVYTLTQTGFFLDTAVNNKRYHTCSYTDQATNYVYAMGIVSPLGTNCLNRYDVTNYAGGPSFSANIAGWDFGRVLDLLAPGSDYLMAGGKNAGLDIISKSSLVWLKKILLSGFELRLSRVDYSSGTTILFLSILSTTAPKPGYIRRYDLTSVIGGGSTLTHTHSFTTGLLDSDVKGTGMQLITFGTVSYLAYTFPTSPNVFYLNKADLTPISSTGGAASSFVANHDGLNTFFCSFNGPYYDPGTQRYYYSRIEATNMNFQSYYLVYDNCTVRGTNDVCTDCAAGYYRFTTSAGGDCVLPADFLPNHGINLPLILMSPCFSTGCISCLLNYQTCVQCNITAGYYLNVSDYKCYTKPTFAAASGAKTVNASAGEVTACTMAHCTACVDDYTVCTACDVPTGWFLYSPTATCVSATTAPLMPAGYGGNTGSGLATLCQDTNCVSCAVAYTSCVQCNLGTGYYLNVTDAKCYSKPTFAASSGAQVINGTAGKVVACSDANCLACVNDYTLCTACNVPGGYYLYTTTSTCKNVATMPAGYGANTVSGQCTLCQDTNCVSCAVAYTSCVQCNLATGYYLNVTDAKCYTKPTFAASSGAKSINGTAGQVVACSDANCLACVNDYTLCTACNVPGGYYLYTTTSTCKNAATMPAGYGGNTGTGVATVCSDTHCTTCPALYTTCTTCQTTPTQYYLYATDSQCYYPPTMPIGKGPSGTSVVSCTDANCRECNNTISTCLVCNSGYTVSAGSCTAAPGMGWNSVTSTMVPCADSVNCDYCVADYQYCTNCKPASGKYAYLGNCILPSAAPAGYGANLATYAMGTCTVSHCNLCQNDRTTCQGCDGTSGNYFYGGSCIPPASIPDGFGVNTATYNVVACSDANCRLCVANYQYCTNCLAASGTYAYGGNCLLPSAAPAGYGADLGGSNTMGTCTVSHCNLCQNDRTTCQGCDGTTGNYFYGGSCIPPASIPAGFGANLLTYMVLACMDPHCGLCAANYLLCSGCVPASGYYLYVSNCILPSASPLGWGPDLFTQLINPCTVPHCSSCTVDRNTCQGCDTNTGYVLYQGACTLISALPAGVGAKLSDGTAQACAQAGCTTCNSNYLTCDGCPQGSYTFNGKCIAADQIPQAYGVDAATKKVVSCTDGNCKKCSANYQICTECDQANGYTLVNGQCQQARSKLLLKSASFKTLNQLAKITFEEAIAALTFTDVKITVMDETYNSVFTCDQSTCQMAAIDKGFELAMKFEKSILKGTLYVEKNQGGIVSATGFKEFSDYPIIIRNIYFEDVRNNITKITKATTTMSTTTKTALSVIGVGFSPAASIMMDKLISNFVYLELLSGPFIAYPDYIFKSAKNLKLLPVNLGNPFNKYSQETECEPPANYQSAEYSCSMLANYGDDMLNLQITLAINIVISLACLIAILWLATKASASSPNESIESARDLNSPRSPQREETARSSLSASFIFEWINENYGVRYFMVQLRGETMKIMCIAMLNLVTKPDGSSMWVGTFVSVFWIGIFILKMVFLHFLIGGFYKERSADANNSRVSKKEIKLTDSKLWFMDFYFENLYVTPKRWAMYIPVLEILKSVVISITVYVLGNYPLAQHCSAITMEVAMLAYLLTSNSRIKIFETVVDTISQTLVVMYVVMKSISTADMSEETRQAKLGLAMAVVLIAMIVIQFAISLFIIVKMVYQSVRLWLSKRKKTGRVGPRTASRVVQPEAGQAGRGKAQFLRNQPEASDRDEQAPKMRPLPASKTIIVDREHRLKAKPVPERAPEQLGSPQRPIRQTRLESPRRQLANLRMHGGASRADGGQLPESAGKPDPQEKAELAQDLAAPERARPQSPERSRSPRKLASPEQQPQSPAKSRKLGSKQATKVQE